MSYVDPWTEGARLMPGARVSFSRSDKILFAYSVCLSANELWWRIVP
jgi:hypothetical protein